VMGSGGDHGGGIGEVRDVRAAVGVAAEAAQNERILACGWSFGANTALRTAFQDPRIGALALIGMPLAESSLDLPALPGRMELQGFDRPVLLLVGEADPFCPLPDLRSLARKLPNATVQVIPGTDHFFWKREREAAEAVGAFAEGWLEK
jgi:pimeloyl-ACP methyl ester carboxylesterase